MPVLDSICGESEEGDNCSDDNGDDSPFSDNEDGTFGGNASGSSNGTNDSTWSCIIS